MSRRGGHVSLQGRGLAFALSCMKYTSGGQGTKGNCQPFGKTVVRGGKKRGIHAGSIDSAMTTISTFTLGVAMLSGQLAFQGGAHAEHAILPPSIQDGIRIPSGRKRGGQELWQVFVSAEA